MENQTPSVKKIAFNYGITLALLVIGLSVLVYVMGMHLEQPWWQSTLNFVFSVTCIVLGLKKFKHDNNGFMSFGQALKTGVAISLIAGVVGSLFTLLFVTVIEPSFAADMLEATRIKMIEQNPNMPEDQMEMALSMTEKFLSPWFMFGLGVIISVFFGFIISLIAGLIMKKENPLQQ